jgi:hypothetical protein
MGRSFRDLLKSGDAGDDTVSHWICRPELPTFWVQSGGVERARGIPQNSGNFAELIPASMPGKLFLNAGTFGAWLRPFSKK